MDLRLKNTITAISTPMGYGGIGIIRISGEEAFNILDEIFKGDTKKPSQWETHTIHYGHIVDEKSTIIDEVFVSVMKAPKTYTREDIVEINCHSGTKVLQNVLELVIRKGAKIAEPGEFTKRAFLNGRIDLSQAEAVIDIINAKTDLSRQTAIQQLSGNISKKVNHFSQEILQMISHIEASIDYPEHDLEQMNLEQINDKCKILIDEINNLISSANKGKIIRDGIETAIIGRPNTGKSSLLNALIDEERAIVTDIAGTTRDILQEYVNINDIPLKIIDTAGIRETQDIIEKIGVEKSRKYAMSADLILVMIDGSKQLENDDFEILNLTENKNSIIIINKSDLPQQADIEKINKYIKNDNIVNLSLKTSSGIESLYEKIKYMFYEGEINVNEEIFINNMRHKDSLIQAVQALQNAINTIQSGLSEDFVSIDLQQSYNFLGEITGETLDEDIVNKIFSEFCLGK